MLDDHRKDMVQKLITESKQKHKIDMAIIENQESMDQMITLEMEKM